MAERRPREIHPAGPRHRGHPSGPPPLDVDLPTDNDSVSPMSVVRGRPDAGPVASPSPLEWSEPTQIIRRKGEVDQRSLVVIRVLLGNGPLQCWVAGPSTSAVLGRAPDADLPIQDPSVSRYHARIDVDASGGLSVSDLGSTNGTFLNGQQVIRHRAVAIGDRVTVGGVGIAVESLSETEVDHLRRAASRLHAADRDAITGLFQRRWLEEDLPAYVEQLRRTGKTATCLFMDLDGFKEINDQHGHLAGDAVLRTVGAIVRRAIRDDDYAVRYGGDEFAVFLTRCDGIEGRRVAERLRVAVSELTVDGIAPGAVTLSVGLAQYDGEAPQEWIDRADGALYRSKRGGRNQTTTA